MSTPTTLWKKWEGRVVDEKFPLRQWLGGSDHSAVFLTETPGAESQKAAIKLIPANGRDTDAQLSRWTAAAKLSHPHLIRLLAWGQCEIDDTPLLYVVMEFAEENLAEILPLRPLAAEEASGMLVPTVDALASLHGAGLVHGGIKPSNIMAVKDQLKISADGLRETGEHRTARAFRVYDAPEVKSAGPSPAADIWSLGATLVAVLTQTEPNQTEPNQTEPKMNSGEPTVVSVPGTLPQPFRDIARQCLQVEPRQRCTLSEILSQLQPHAPAEKTVDRVATGEARAPESSKRWIAISILVAATLIVAALLGFKSLVHRPEVPAAEPRPATTPAEAPAVQTPAPFSDNKKPAEKGLVRGSVQQQVLPEVSHSAQNTITGRVKVSVRVSVDTSGNVSEAKFVWPGPSKYFSNLALNAARRWKFTPPQVDGQAVESEWVLRFQFARASTQVFPAEVKP
jgi:TonB family protein